MSLSLSQRDNPDAREAVRLATRLHGSKRGWFLAAAALGISERTARALGDGTTSGATICALRAAQARLDFRRQRAEQLRAELRELGEALHGEAVAVAGAPVRPGSGGVPVGRGLVRGPGPALGWA